MANSKREGEERGVWSWGDGYFSGEWSIFIGCLSHLVDMNSHRLSKQGEICEKIVIKWKRPALWKCYITCLLACANAWESDKQNCK